MRVLVTGASGFIGSALTTELLRRGHQVAGLTRQDPNALPPGAVYLQGDLQNSPWDEIEKFAPDACVHSAWIATPGVYLESPENDDWVVWSLAFFERLGGLGVRRMVALGTCIEYQITGEILREGSTPLAPLTRYARAKDELRQRLARSAAIPQAALAWARIFYPYGEGEHPARLCSSLIAKLTRNEVLTLNTPHSTKDYIHIQDVAKALATILESDFSGEINVGTGVGVTVEQLARTIACRLGKDDFVDVQPIAKPDPYGYVVACVDRLQSLGWRPSVTLEQGVDRLIQVMAI